MNTTTKVPPRRRLSVERIRRRWMQLKVADQLGTTPGNVSRWEHVLTSPGPYFRRKLCELFSMSVHELDLIGDASVEFPAQKQTSTIIALKEAQADQGRGGKDSVQTAIESASCPREDSPAVLLVKANTLEMRGEGLTMLPDGLKRPEQGQEGFAQVGTHSLHISPD